MGSEDAKRIAWAHARFRKALGTASEGLAYAVLMAVVCDVKRRRQ